MLSLKSSGIYPDLYILLISLVIIGIPFSPMHCSNSAEMLSLPQAFPFGNSLITASISSLQIVYTSFSIYPISMISSTPLLPSLYNSSTYSAHLSITSSFSIRTFPCLLLIVCNTLFPFGRSSLIFWYINWLCALSNISISLHLSSQYLSLTCRHIFRFYSFSFLYCSSSLMFLHFLLSSILFTISEFIQFCFFGCISFPQISSAAVEIPAFNLFQISSTSLHQSIFSSCSC